MHNRIWIDLTLMIDFLRSSMKALISLVLIFTITACSTSASAGLEPFKSTDGRYGFLYPTGWTRVAVDNGPVVVFHDLINSEETLSLVISGLTNEVNLENLGTPEQVGDRVINQLITSDDQNRSVKLVSSQERESAGRVFYDLEYTIKYPNSERHELATLVINNGSLYTFAVGTDEKRWGKVKVLFSKVIDSFTLLI